MDNLFPNEQNTGSSYLCYVTRLKEEEKGKEDLGKVGVQESPSVGFRK